jgi:hypothetical protein
MDILSICMNATTHVPDEARKPRPCGYEWRTESTLYGLPLIHVAWGRDKDGRKLIAKGIIGIGQYAMGLISISQFGIGAICITQFGIGLFAVAQFSIALASVSQFTVAIYTITQMGISYEGIGQHLLRVKELMR